VASGPAQPIGVDAMKNGRQSLLLLAALVAAWQPSKAMAADEDTEFWLFGTVRGNLSDDVFLGMDAAYRWRGEGSDNEQQTFRVTLEHSIFNRSRLGGGGAVLQTDGVTEIRPHQQFRFTSGGLDVRTRFEQRFFQGAQQVELRFRQRVQYTLPVGRGVEAFASGEWLTVLQGREATRPTGTQQVRALAGTIVTLGNGFEVRPAYLAIYSPRPDQRDGLSHIPQITINYVF
jgi:hypothetical protein